MKLVEGQLEYWKMLSDFSSISSSTASQTFRDFVRVQEAAQQLAPDIVPTEYDFSPLIEAETGKITHKIG